MIFKVGDILPNTPHLFADLAELVAIINYTGRHDLHKNDLLTISSQSNVSTDEADEEEAEANLEPGDAERSDRVERQLEDVWKQLEYREQFLGDMYPFEIVDDFIKLKNDLNHNQRIYRLMVSCSRLWSFRGNGGLVQLWAKHFTELSKYALTGLVPPHAKVRIFDANSEDRRTHYGTNLREALKVLGKDLGVPSIIKEACDAASSSGDGGFDIIATVEFPDQLSSNFGILGQCGAQGKSWPSKTLEAHSIKLRTFYQVHFDHPSVMFTPVFFRTAQGKWVDTAPCAGVIILDRYRILHLLSQTTHSKTIVDSEWFKTFETNLESMVLQ